MCGRFTLTASSTQIRDVFNFIQAVPVVKPHYNIAPSQSILCIRQLPQQTPELVSLRWGFVPPWMEEEAIRSHFINARAETVESKPMFKKAFRSQRCIILASGFFEWQPHPKKKQPYFIHLKHEPVFGMAGIWSCWQKGDRTIESCAIIVTEANAVVAPIHDRMPVILKSTHYEDWLNPLQNHIDLLKSYLTPYPASEIEAYPVSFKVNSPAYDLPDTILPIISE